MEDIAYLVTEKITGVDDDGNELKKWLSNRVFCKVRSVTRSEFYNAATDGLKPNLDITISHRIDYNGEKVVWYNDQLYDVIRTYWNGDEVELTLQSRIGNIGIDVPVSS